MPMIIHEDIMMAIFMSSNTYILIKNCFSSTPAPKGLGEMRISVSYDCLVSLIDFEHFS